MKSKQVEVKGEISIKLELMEGAEEETQNNGSSIMIKEMSKAMHNGITTGSTSTLKQTVGAMIR